MATATDRWALPKRRKPARRPLSEEPTEQEKYDAMLAAREESERTRGVSRHYEPVGTEGVKGPEDQPWWMFLSPEEAALAKTVEEAKARPPEEAASRARVRELGGPGKWEDTGTKYRPKGPTVEELQAGATRVSPELKKKYEGLSPRAREKERELGTQGTRLKEQADREQVGADEDRKKAAGFAEQGKLKEAQFFEDRADKRGRTATDLSAQARDVMEKGRGQAGWVGGRPVALGSSPDALARARTLGDWDKAVAGEPEEEPLRLRTPADFAAAETVNKLKKSGQYAPTPEGEAQYRADLKGAVEYARLTAGEEAEPKEGKPLSEKDRWEIATMVAAATGEAPEAAYRRLEESGWGRGGAPQPMPTTGEGRAAAAGATAGAQMGQPTPAQPSTAPAAPAASVPPAPPVEQREVGKVYIFPNGKKAIWRGTGWEPVL